ncbi:MAG: type II toxin-antitoxin system RelE/ParE family toxin [Steroidobacteraceae bacterium]
MFEVRQTAEFSRWLGELPDPVGRAAVLTRLARLGLGNPGDVKSVGARVWELRIDVGPGYRAYYMRAGEQVYLMLGGGDKSSQAKDVDRAIRMAGELKSAARAKKARKSK